MKFCLYFLTKSVRVADVGAHHKKNTPAFPKLGGSEGEKKEVYPE